MAAMKPVHAGGDNNRAQDQDPSGAVLYETHISFAERGGSSTVLDSKEEQDRDTAFAAVRDTAFAKGQSDRKCQEDSNAKKPKLHVIRALDVYAVREQPGSLAGGTITLLAVAALLAYTGYIVFTWVDRPWSVDATNAWTYASGPWPMRLRCRADSGCWVSNRVQSKWTQGVAVRPEQQGCAYVRPGDWVELDVAFSNSPNDGVSVIYVPGPSNSSVLPPGAAPVTEVPGGFGMEIESTVTCVGDPEMCQDGVQLLLSPVTTGVTLLFLVETTNHSAGGIGAFRREFYPTQVSMDADIVAATTPCDAAQLAGAGYKQARLRLNSEFAKVTVDRDALWLVVWGAVGGAMSLFIQVGGLVLGAISITMQMVSRRREQAAASL